MDFGLNLRNKTAQPKKMTDNQSSYRQIFKATSLFGGVQVVGILISVIRSKFVAVFLGTTGVGILSLFQSTTNLIGTLTSLGIDTSAVRDISEANGTNDTKRIARVITIFRRWIWVTGLLGTVLTFCMAPLLSKWTFGNREYTMAFIWLSSTFLLGSLSTGQITLLHGLQKLKQMAKANIAGAVFGLLFSIPLYYKYGIKGIVPTMILTTLTALIISWRYSHNIKIEKATISLKETLSGGLGMVKLGILITLSSSINLLVSYLVNIFISRTGNLGDVGLYQAGWNITNKYVGLVFTAMVVDYFPRLSKINNDNLKVSEVVNQQSEIAILILSPILILLLSTTPIVISILYTKEFLPVVTFIEWVVLGILFRALAWTLGFIPLAKGDAKLYFWKEFLSSMIILTSNLAGYYLGGLEGLGISFALSNFLIFFFMQWICRHKYDFHFSYEFRKIFIFHFLLCLLAFLITYRLGFPWAYASGAIFFLIIGWHSWKTLDNKINLKQLMIDILKKKKNNK